MSLSRAQLLSLLLPAFLVVSAAHATDLKQVKSEVESGKALLVDVREPQEWEKGHLRDARSLPMSAFAQGKVDLGSLPKDRPIYLHCSVGSRSRRVAAFLKGKGFDARSLDEGYPQLKAAGFADAGR